MIFNYYQIENLINHKIYIGITELPVEKRFKQHQKMLNNRTHPNYFLQPDWDKYGENNFKFSLIESKDFNNLEDGYFHEYELIQNNSQELYNIQPGGLVNPIKNKNSYEKMVETKQNQVPNIYALEEVSENVFKIIEKYPSQKAAARANEKWSQANIQKALRGHYKSYNYFWVEENDIISNLANWKPTRTKMRPTAKLDSEGNIIEVHHNPRNFEKINNYKAGVISASICHKTKCYGNQYKYISEEEYYSYIPITLIK